MFQIYGVRKVFAEKYSAKLNRKRQTVWIQMVEFQKLQFHFHSVGTYVRRIGAKSALLDALLNWNFFVILSIEF